MSDHLATHPNIYPRLDALSRDRAAATLSKPTSVREAYLATEFSSLEADSIGFDARMGYAETVTHVWEAFVASERMMFRMADRLPETDGLQHVVISDLPPLRIPDVFYAHYGEEVGLFLEDQPSVFIDGVYFWHTSDFGEPTYVYVVTCGTVDADYEAMSLGELTMEKTRVAIGTVDPTQHFHDTLRDLTGDPSVCRAVSDTVVKDVIALTLALISDPRATPDIIKEVNISVAPTTIGRRH